MYSLSSSSHLVRRLEPPGTAVLERNSSPRCPISRSMKLARSNTKPPIHNTKNGKPITPANVHRYSCTSSVDLRIGAMENLAPRRARWWGLTLKKISKFQSNSTEITTSTPIHAYHPLTAMPESTPHRPPSTRRHPTSSSVPRRRAPFDSRLT